MFENFGSIKSLELFSYFALITCVLQIIVNQLIKRLYRNRNNQEYICKYDVDKEEIKAINET